MDQTIYCRNALAINIWEYQTYKGTQTGFAWCPSPSLPT